MFSRRNKKITIFGLYPLIFLILFLILICNVYYIQSSSKPETKVKEIWHPFLTSLFFIMMLGIGLDFIGARIPFLNKLGLGFLLCILVPSFLVYQEIIKKPIYEQLKFFISNTNNGINFTKFFITIVVVGSILNIERDLLKRVILKFIPLTLFIIFISFYITGFLGYLLNYQIPNDFQKNSQGSFRDSIFFISVPLTNGGINLGINGFSEGHYQNVFGVETEKIKSTLLAPLIIARILSIFMAGFLSLVFDKTKYSGKGYLEKNKGNLKTKNITKHPLDYQNIGVGLLIILGFYSLGNMINQLLTFHQNSFGLDTMVYIIILSLIVKFVNLIPQEYQNYVVQAGNFMIINFMAPMLVALGLTTDFSTLLLYMKDFHTILLVFTSLSTAVIVSFYLASFFAFYPLEFALVAGIASHSIGGTGNVGVMSISNRMKLLPFAVINNRIVGIFVFTLFSLFFRQIYK